MADKQVNALTSSTPTIDDLTISYDNADTSELKKTTWQLVRDLFKTYFDTVYQAVLVSGTNIKTINSTSILGSGDIVISGGGSVATDTIWDAKGDLAVGTGANNASRLAVGSNGQILVADSTQATGVKWATASGTGDMLASTYDPANIAQQVVGTTATQTISGKTLTAPKFVDNGFIADSNGNEMVSFNQNASAVNYLEIENGSTTNPPHLRAMGDDANIGLHLVGRGTGLVSVCDATDETKRIRFQPNNSTGVTTTLASSDTASHTITLPNRTGTLADDTDLLSKANLAGSISQAFNVSQLEVGNVSDTTISRVSAGVIAVEGKTIPFSLLPSTATDGATVTFDLSTNNKHQVTIAGNRTLALSNTTNIPAFMINIKQDATSSRTVTWFSGITWAGGSAPTLTTTANKTDSFGFQQISAGVYLGFVIAQNI